jgi:SecD/SecF fusion protein
MSDRQRHGFILLLVAGLIAASVVVMTQFTTRLGLDLKGGVELVYQGKPTAQSGVTQASLSRAVDVMRNRVDQLGVAEPLIQTSPPNQIVVQLPAVTDITRAENEVGTTARLEFYDWEANAITPAGTPVANGLATQDPSSLAISTGGAAGPGAIGTGSMGLYDAVKLASKQPYQPSRDNARLGSEYYLFGAPGSQACATAAKFYGTVVVPGVHCLLDEPPIEILPNAAGVYPSTASVESQLQQSLPTGVTLAQAQQFVVKQGTVVVQATPTNFSSWPAFGKSPTAQYYVLHDHVALFGSEITNPQQSTGADGLPDVQFGFTGKGGNAFQSVTAKLATRGELVSTGSTTLDQHFAVALDNRLVTVPQIDYKVYPAGITGGGGADISGNFTIATAQDLATQLRLGALPIRLVRISDQQVSATLGKQALDQGLLAGIVGLGVVILFLLAYYRLLGLIAVAGLVVYGIYFYALIKLIPITMTLAGIAGLILTIGVAADANIVIFERVKEEIRAGRSIRHGIAIGYRKGLTAIIDANVVTILTAFILFVLATADVKGFAFTLGIGVFVSLFTAVLATQAILMTIGDSRLISHASALGAAGKKHVWRYDFMGASRYFFSMSGVILLIGALAVGGRGLHLGIDFTSGTQVSVGLQRPATVAEIKSVMGTVGAGNATIQRVTGDKALGPYGFQVEAPFLNQARNTQLRSELQSRYGLRTSATGSQDFNDRSVGPTFGATIANSAVIAIIASLLVISAYVALRFDWKFAVPTLIALMHDLLITSGVYALTGRVVTTDTVAALLTILGYSLYDTIIVFDRVRENIPRMPRAAFSQIVNRSMSEVLTRSLATTSCTLLPIIALLLFGGTTLKDFAFALLIGVASGAYSSIFIASPVLTHWKERETTYRHRRERLTSEFGAVPAYAEGNVDIDPTPGRVRRGGRITQDDGGAVSSAEFEQMKRDLGLEEEVPSGHTSGLSQRLAHTRGAVGTAKRGASPAKPAPPKPAARGQRATGGTPPKANPPKGATPPKDATPQATPPRDAAPPPAPDESGDFTRAPDLAENEGMAQMPPKAKSARSRNRKHGRR